jgi:adenine deaminase
VLRHAIDCGCDPLVALQMATINTASHFGLEREIGSLTPGRRADVILTSDLRTLPIETVIARGQIVAQQGACLVDCPHLDWPDSARQTVNMAKDLSADDFIVTAPKGANAVTANVIGVVENQAPTRALKFELPVTDGQVQSTGEVCQIALVERHRASGTVVNAFVSGFGYEGAMAMASTVAHDSHHMIVVGTDPEQMALAANRLRAVGGGITIFREGTELALVELPIAGLMSDSPATNVAAKAEQMMQAMRDCGCTLNNAYMQHSLLALVVIPELRISDLGLVDVRTFEFIPVLEPLS